MVEKTEGIVAKQVEAIKNLKIDKVTVWDSGGGEGALRRPGSFPASSGASRHRTTWLPWPGWTCRSTWAGSPTSAWGEMTPMKLSTGGLAAGVGSHGLTE